MRAISKPDLCTKYVFEKCVSGIIRDTDLKDRFSAISDDIYDCSCDYDDKAQKQVLTDLSEFIGDDSTTVLGNLNKDNFVKLYENFMRGETKPARKIYDHLLSSAPKGKCPFCSIGDATTLDHYLPKAKFPQFSVLPYNLVPSCKDCNTGKGSHVVVNRDQQVLHPYYDKQYINEQWIFAKIITTDPIVVRYFVQPPEKWDNFCKNRVIEHFNEFALAKRFSVQAVNELDTLNFRLKEYFSQLGYNAVVSELQEQANTHIRIHPNSWQSAMYQALAASDWYCRGGYQPQ